MNRFLRKPANLYGHDLTRSYENSSRDNSTATLEEALRHHRSGRMHMAAELYQKVLQNDPTNPDALYLLALWSIAHGEYEQAANHLSKATTSFPDFKEAWCHYGTSLRGLGRTEDAVMAFERALELDTRNVDAFFHLGEVCEDMGNSSEAIKNYRAAVSIDKRQDYAFVRLAKAYFAQNHFDEAMSACHSAILANPRNSEAYNQLGLALFAMGQVSSAGDSFKTAIKLNPGFAEAYGNLGQT